MTDQEDFARPFLRKNTKPAADRMVMRDVDDTRSYLLTGGRTGGGAANVRLETIVQSSHPDRELLNATTEEAAIYVVCMKSPLSVAEIAIATGLPFGVAQVIIGDLVANNILTQSTAPVDIHGDIPFIERLISRVSAL